MTEAKETVAFTLLVIPQPVLSPLLARGRLARPFRVLQTPRSACCLARPSMRRARRCRCCRRRWRPPFCAISRGWWPWCAARPTQGQEVGRRSVQAARLEAVRQHIDEHLADPTLSPASMAAALGISLRQLHLLFEQTGTTFGQYVLRQRLLKCHDGHRGGDRATRKVADVAFGWGFNSMPTFYRAFAAEFGTEPSTLRSGHRHAIGIRGLPARRRHDVAPVRTGANARRASLKVALMPDVAGALFYERLFTVNPQFRALFKHDMRVQGVKLMMMLAAIVSYLDDPGRNPSGSARHGATACRLRGEGPRL